MTRIGITGHQDSRGKGGWRWVRSQIAKVLTDIEPPTIGITSLAAGADQVFAECVVQAGGMLHVVVPFSDYPQLLNNLWRSRYERLLSASSVVEVLKGSPDREVAYLAAGLRVLALADIMVAVWDGEPPRGKGGTGDIVERAVAKGIPVVHINPVERLVRRL